MGHAPERGPRTQLGPGGARSAGRALILVLDASAALWAATGARDLRGRALVAPPLLWSEVHAMLHLWQWRGSMSPSDATRHRARVIDLGIERRTPERLYDEAWAIADELGVARTHDCEYLALARLLRTRVLTLDGRLRRGADRLGLTTDPAEL